MHTIFDTGKAIRQRAKCPPVIPAGAMVSRPPVRLSDQSPPANAHFLDKENPLPKHRVNFLLQICLLAFYRCHLIPRSLMASSFWSLSACSWVISQPGLFSSSAHAGILPSFSLQVGKFHGDLRQRHITSTHRSTV